jgi:microcompartment protein CcmL/EutN
VVFEASVPGQGQVLAAVQAALDAGAEVFEAVELFLSSAVLKPVLGQALAEVLELELELEQVQELAFYPDQFCQGSLFLPT